MLRRMLTHAALAGACWAPQGIAFGQNPADPVKAAAPGELHAQERLPAVVPDDRWSLEQLESMAFVNNPSLARAQALVEAARGNHVQVGLPPNPQVGYSGQQIGSQGLAEQDGVVVNQDFVRGNKLGLNRNIAYQDVVVAEQRLAAQQFRVKTDVRVAYFQVLIAQRQIDKTNELVALNDQAAKSTESLFKGREIAKGDVLQARLELENARLLLISARNRHAAAWQRLVAVVGLPQLPCRALAGDAYQDCGPICWGDALQRLTSGSPEIAVAMANIEKARWTYQRALAEPKPNINVQGLVNVRDNGIGGRPDGAVQVTMPIPVWNRNQGAITEARFNSTAAERALEQLELSLHERLAPVFERYTSARAQVERYRTVILPTAEEALELVRKSFQGGEVGFISLLTVQRTFAQTNLAYLDALRELKTAEAEIDGLLLSGSLQN